MTFADIDDVRVARVRLASAEDGWIETASTLYRVDQLVAVEFRTEPQSDDVERDPRQEAVRRMNEHAAEEFDPDDS